MSAIKILMTNDYMVIDNVTKVVAKEKSDQRVASVRYAKGKAESKRKLSTSRAIPLQKIMNGSTSVLVASLDTSKLDCCRHKPVVGFTLFFAPYLHVRCLLNFGHPSVYMYI